jgi:hypothetical protein
MPGKPCRPKIVREDEIICEISTDKVSVEIVAPGQVDLYGYR